MGREIIQWQSANIDPTSRHHNAPIATILRSLDYVTRQDLRHAWALQKASLAPLERILIAEKMITSKQLLTAQCLKYRAFQLATEMQPPDPDLAQLLPAEFCQAHNLVPWRRRGAKIIIANSAPDSFAHSLAAYPEIQQQRQMGLCSQQMIRTTLTKRHNADFC